MNLEPEARTVSDRAFADNERDQLARWATLTYAQRLQWLWDAKLFAQRAQRATLVPLQSPALQAVEQPGTSGE